jgi:tetratricopeptide (TPR) repeat protein
VKHLLGSLLLLLWMPLWAQDDAAAARFIRFHSAEEEAAFQHLGEHPSRSAVINLMLLAPPAAHKAHRDQVEQRLAAFVKAQGKLNGSTITVKQLKQLFKDVQDAFLVRYSINALFPDLFINGDFNCLTASALFALLLDELKVPYRIHLTPDHVYVSALVQGSPVSIETTDPVRGVFVFTDRARRQYVEHLLKGKHISRHQIDSLGVDGALATVVRADSIISLRQLCGSHYYNSGVTLRDKGELDMALSQLAKALSLHPYPQTREVLHHTLVQRIAECRYDDLADVDLLTTAYAFVGTTGRGEYIVADHARLLDKHLIQRSDTTMARALEAKFLAVLDDEGTAQQIRFAHAAEMGRYFALRGNFERALAYFLIASSINPQHAQISEWVVSALVERLKRARDKGAFIAELDAMKAANPRLSEVASLSKCYLITHLWAVEDHFNIDDRRNAETHLRAFETLQDSSGLELPVEALAAAYMAGWRSWTRARDKVKARAYIDRGLKYAPFSEDLHRASRYSTY